MEDITLWLWYTMAMGGSKVTARKMYVETGSVKKLYEYTRSDYKKFGLKDNLIDKLSDKSLDGADRTLWFAEKYGVKILPFDIDEYPALLKNIYDPPLVLYVRGTHFDPANELYIAIIGTSKISEYGRSMATALAKDLAAAGVTVVGGMSAGVETVAHKSAIEAGGYTTAVLTTGVNMVNPKSNAELMRRILNSGAVVSEYGFDEPCYPSAFAARNRIISGLCVGTVVVEAAAGSRSLMTANFALDQGRDVFAVPGNVDKASSGGVNELLKDSAKMVTNVMDILEDYNTVYPDLIKTGGFSSNELEFDFPSSDSHETNMEKTILTILGEKPMRYDALIASTSLTSSQLNGTLTMLEIMDKITQDKFGNYKIK
ncbi:MAG: DNA-processing protein DprA [Monoglobales bacterium]